MWILRRWGMGIRGSEGGRKGEEGSFLGRWSGRRASRCVGWVEGIVGGFGLSD